MLLAAALRARATGAARAVLAAHNLPARAQHTPSPSGQPSFPYVAAGDGVDSAAFTVVRKDGADIIHDPLTNKGTAFSYSERERLKLRGLLPTKTLSLDRQAARFMDDYETGAEFVDPNEIADTGITKDHVRRWKALQELQDRNETLFYHVLLNSFPEMAPIVYTPVVGWAALNFHKLYRRPRGMYFGLEDRGEMLSMTFNWPSNEVDAIVVTDGSRILGLGDLGLNGLSIPIGKLDLYVAAAGFHPARVLPVVLDVGTDNERLRTDPLYMGIRKPRLRGDAYFEFVDEFVRAVTTRWPRAVLQFEDFELAHARPLLQRYRDKHLVFNDDIQGTAATAVAGLYGALAVQGLAASAITQQRFVVVGAGSAGIGVARMLAGGMRKHGLSKPDALARFRVIDAGGLITAKRPDLPPVVASFAARGPDDVEGESLVDVIRRFKPTALIGLAGAGRLFTPDVLRAVADVTPNPIVFAMSNPQSRMECTAEDAQKYTGGRAIFASGSPQADVTLACGSRRASSQCNNMYVFPGLAMGAHLGKTGIVSDGMLTAAAEALPSLILPEDLAAGQVYPRLSDVRAVTSRVAAAVLAAAGEEGRVASVSARAALEAGPEATEAYVTARMYKPRYHSLIRLPVGVLE